MDQSFPMAHAEAESEERQIKVKSLNNPSFIGV